jgi:hypothetical protein
MSGLYLRGGYQFNAPAFGVPGVVLLTATTNPTVYQAKPSDYLVLVDLSGYGGAGPAITLAVPVEDYPVTVRNIAGSGAAHNWSVNAPAALAGGFEDPANPGNFVSAVNISVANFEGTWVLDRVRNRLVLLDPDFAAAGPSAPVNGTTADSTAHTLTSVVLPASPSVVIVDVKYDIRDTTAVTTSGAGEIQGAFVNNGGTAVQLGTTQVISVKGQGSAGFTVSTNQVNFQGTGNGNASNWTMYVSTFPNTT